MQKRSYISQSQKLTKGPTNITKLEQNLFNKLDDVFTKGDIGTYDESFNRVLERNQGGRQDLLMKARNIVNEKQQQNPNFFEEGKLKLQKEQLKEQQKKGTFLITAVNMVKEKKQEVPLQREYEPEQLNEMDLLRDIMQEESKPYDDLAELRKMIISTKKNIGDYAEGLYNLKGTVQVANSNARNCGYGVGDHIFDDMDRGFYKYMPNGNKQDLFPQKQAASQVKLPTNRSKSRERVMKKSATVNNVGMKIRRK